MPRNLVIVRAGDASLHSAWLGDEDERDWDIIVSYYGDNPDLFRDKDQRRMDAKGAKWPALNELVQSLQPEMEQYDYVWLPDDDLVADAQSINQFFALCREYALDLAQPSLTLDSIAGHIVTLTNRSFKLRYTNFVEIMCPCFSRAFLRRCAPSFGANISGWGLDHLWPTWAASPDKVAIIDAVAVKHTRARGNLYRLYKETGMTPECEMAELLLRHNIRSNPMTTGGIDHEDQLHAAWNGRRKKLIELLLTGYLPELGNYPEHVFRAIEPILEMAP